LVNQLLSRVALWLGSTSNEHIMANPFGSEQSKPKKRAILQRDDYYGTLLEMERFAKARKLLFRECMNAAAIEWMKKHKDYSFSPGGVA